MDTLIGMMGALQGKWGKGGPKRGVYSRLCHQYSKENSWNSFGNSLTSTAKRLNYGKGCAPEIADGARKSGVK